MDTCRPLLHPQPVRATPTRPKHNFHRDPIFNAQEAVDCLKEGLTEGITHTCSAAMVASKLRNGLLLEELRPAIFQGIVKRGNDTYTEIKSSDLKFILKEIDDSVVIQLDHASTTLENCSFKTIEKTLFTDIFFNYQFYPQQLRIEAINHVLLNIVNRVLFNEAMHFLSMLNIEIQLNVAGYCFQHAEKLRVARIVNIGLQVFESYVDAFQLSHLQIAKEILKNSKNHDDKAIQCTLIYVITSFHRCSQEMINLALDSSSNTPQSYVDRLLSYQALVFMRRNRQFYSQLRTNENGKPTSVQNYLDELNEVFSKSKQWIKVNEWGEEGKRTKVVNIDHSWKQGNFKPALIGNRPLLIFILRNMHRVVDLQSQNP
jgi:hypothetical protein